MKILLIVGIIIFLQNVFAKDRNPQAERTVIVAERNTHVGIEQVGVAVEGNKVVATSNTNILNKDFPYYYGKFESKADATLKKEIEGLKRKENLKIEIYPSLHDVNIYVNGLKIPANDKRFDQALSVIQSVFKSPNLVLRDGTIVKSLAELKKITCQKEERVCKFKFGYIHE